MKKVLLIILLIFGICDCTADNRYLVLWMQDGTSTSFELSQSPRITFSIMDMVIKCGGWEISYPFSEVLGYSYSSKTSGIVQIDLSKENLECFIGNGFLSIKYVEQGAIIEVFDMSGIRLLSYKATDSGSCEIPFNYGDTKIFIVAINGKSFKIKQK